LSQDQGGLSTDLALLVFASDARRAAVRGK
jgi:hypothetical protein